MASKLTDITASFHTFETDQVLTAGQLNEVVNYLDDQNRLTRTSLNGVGIVCGFKVDNTTNTDQISIGQGCGVTTDGDLIHLQNPGSEGELKTIKLSNIVYTHYRSFPDTNAHYLPFKRNNEQLTLWELLPKQENNEDELKNLEGFRDMVVLLYVESYEKKESLCDGLSCDNQGVHQVSDLRVLLVSQNDAEHILQSDALFKKHDLMPTYLQLGDPELKRIFIPDTIDDLDVLAGCFSLQPETGVITAVQEGLTRMKTKMDPYFKSSLFESIVLGISAKLLTDTKTELYYQYRYDLLRDVLDTYNELKEAFLTLLSECCPALDAFPKHLMLGKVNANEDDELAGRYRHSFMRSPAAATSTTEFARFKSLLQRMDEQLKNYPDLPEDENNALARPEVKITPSRYGAPLGQKAIPFYYNLTLPLLQAWNYDKTSRGKYTRNTAYDTALLALPNPLEYNLEPYNFFRIEGHQGADYREVIKTLDSYKKKFGLSFDVKAIGIYEDPDYEIDPEDYECEFEDLSVLLKAWVKEQECNLASVTSLISAFSLEKPGLNIKDSTYLPRKGFIPLETASTTAELAPESIGSFAAAPAETTSGTQKPYTLNLAALTTPQGKSEQQEVIALNSRYRQSNNTVIENLTVVEKTVGHAVLKGIRSNIGGSAQDIINDAGVFAYDTAHEDDEVVWEQPIYTALVDNSIEILAYSHVLANSIPLSVADINDEIILNYNTNITRLCTVLKRIQVSHKNTAKMTKTNDAILGLLINQLSSICCSSKQLQTLLEEIDRRKDAILTRLTLAEFVKEHPGIEHLGGVVPGGTFVLVYLKKKVLDSGKILADFSLPYMCCSDCAPINYIIPKANVRLNLPKSIFCLGNDVSPMAFQVDPPEGIITASVEIDGLFIEGNLLRIEEESFPEEYLNKVITFKVDDQPTDCQIRVVKPVSADFLVPETPATDTFVHFKTIGTIPEGTQYHWDFGDGETSSLKEPSHNYRLPINATNTVTVKLTLTPPGGACPTFLSHDIGFDQVEISLAGSPFCISDTKRYDFVITPAGATAAISVPGITADGKGFVPANSVTGVQAVYLNGKEVFTIEVNPLPGVTATASIEENMLVVSGSAKDEESVTWSFVDMDGNKVYKTIEDPEEKISLSEFTNIAPGAKFKAIFAAYNPCGSRETAITLTYPANTESCAISATMDVRTLRDQVAAVINDPDTFKKLSPMDQDLYQTVVRFFGKVVDQTPVYLSGNANSDVLQRVPSYLDKICSRIIETIYEQNGASNMYMRLLYQWVLEMFVTIYQCQDESNWKGTSNTFTLIESQINKEIKGSLPYMGYDIDPDDSVEYYLTKVLEYRDAESGSYLRIEKLIKLLQDGGSPNEK